MPLKSRHPGIPGSNPLGRSPSRSARVELPLSLPAADHRVYALAVRRLRRALGANAPDIVALIQHELSDRDVAMIVADYLETLARRARAAKVPLQPPATVVTRSRSFALPRRSLGRDGPTSPDPSRN